MLGHLIDACTRLGRDQRGNVFILFAASVIPLFLVMGGAIDLARYARYKVDLANAVDAGALALARQGEGLNEAQATTFVENYVTSFPVGDDEFAVQNFDVDITDRGYIVTADGAMKTIFLPLGYFAPSRQGIMSMDVDILSEVVRGSNQVELALVFDNTGSMSYSAGSNPCGTGSTRMAGLKCAATTLVEDLMDEMNESGGEDQLKVALVPFEGSVNVNVSSSNPPSWIEWSDESATDDSNQPYYTGINFDEKDFGGSDWRKISPRWLYEKIGISWAGCVEMRAEPYDVLDTTPTSAIPDTLFVPMFWPDEPDSSSAWNNYLYDSVSGSWHQRQKSLTKYDKSSPSQVYWRSGRKDTTYPYSYGPNRGCPRPLTPLTSNETTVLNAINAMQAQGATGTFIPVGLAWGWHVLSPGEPYTEGRGPGDEDYEKTIKAVVLLTDGENSPSISITSYYNKNEATFSAYNYPGTEADHVVSGVHYYRRLQNVNVNSDPSESTAKSALDGKTSTLCSNAKDGGIRLYTITFGSIGESTKTLMRDCASDDSEGNALYFDAPNSQELDDIFQMIGEDLSEIHLAM